MLQNNLDPEVAEHPDELVVYGGTGKAARDWASFDAIVRTLETLKGDETMLVQSGRPVGVMQTHEWAPRVLLANSNLVGDWANWDEFRRLEKLGLTMYGQMTAGSWIYIGTQGILQGTYETFSASPRRSSARTLAGHDHPHRRPRRHGRRAAARRDDERRCRDLRRRRPVAHPRRLEHGYLDVEATILDRRPRARVRARDGSKPLSASACSQRGRGLSRAAREGRRDRHRHRPDHRARPARRYMPLGYTLEEGADAAQGGPDGYADAARAAWPKRSRRCSR